MNCIQRGLILLAAAAAMAGCNDQSDNKTRHRSLADAAASLRSNAMVDTTWRGHLNWNGSGKILKDSDCYFLDRDYIMVGLGDGVTLRLVYRAAQSGVMASVDWQQPVLVELQVAEGRSDGAYYRAEPPPADASDITTEGNTSFGQTRLNAINEAARGANPEGVVAEFEFRCS